MTPLFRLEGVTRSYGSHAVVHALDGVDLTIEAGDHMAIIGPSGSGKSTLLGLLGCLDRPTSGRVEVNGVDVGSLGDARRSRVRGDVIGFVFQQFHLVPHLTAIANVETALLYRGVSRHDRRDRALAALDRVGLADRHDHRPVELSGGEQQRVAIARALVTEPRMILADEPTGALDTRNASLVMEIFDGLRSPERATVVVTHDLGIADRMDRVVSMRDGKVVGDERRAADVGAEVRA
jgi:putative ABC transport system ATP-binding protein